MVVQRQGLVNPQLGHDHEAAGIRERKALIGEALVHKCQSAPGDESPPRPACVSHAELLPMADSSQTEGRSEVR